jgi:hypothetical protein
MKHYPAYHPLNAFDAEAKKSIDVSSFMITPDQMHIFRVLYLHIFWQNIMTKFYDKILCKMVVTTVKHFSTTLTLTLRARSKVIVSRLC